MYRFKKIMGKSSLDLFKEFLKLWMTQESLMSFRTVFVFFFSQKVAILSSIFLCLKSVEVKAKRGFYNFINL